MLERIQIGAIHRMLLPERYWINSVQNGLSVRCLREQQREVEVNLEFFRSRGVSSRRVLAQIEDGRVFIIEFGNYDEIYENVSGIIRARLPIIDNNILRLDNPRYRESMLNPAEATETYKQVYQSWTSGIRYNSELAGSDGNIIRSGLRKPQTGALHAIACHWTLSKDPACIILPTGTGKTEVMIASAVAAVSKRTLVIVPTDPLRQQTADKFITYGILNKIGIIDNLPYPIVGILSSRPTHEHFEALRNCNIVIATMSSIRLAEENIQKDFAALFSHIYFDEAHHIEAITWKRFQKHLGSVKTLLLTATPFREDGKHVQGKMIYNFPLSAAQEQGYFKQIRFIEVFEPNENYSDQKIAETAVTQLRKDIAAGYNHFLMARAQTIDAAKKLFEKNYAPNYDDLDPVLIHSGIPGKKAILKAIRNGEHKIIVCVDMFGEGFDLPNLKIAALHSVHKSLGVTLQFIGRFARSTREVGEAKFVANTAEDGVPESLEALYREDANWNALLADLSYAAIDPQARLSELIDNLKEIQPQKMEEISVSTLRPKISAQVYRTDRFDPEKYREAFRSKEEIFQAHLSQADNLLVLIVNQKDRIDWSDCRDIAIDSWDLYLAYFDPEKGLLYTHCSRKGDATGRLARAIANDPVLIRNEETFKVFTGLRRLTLHSVGLSSHSRNVRYQMFAGLDVRDAINPVQQQTKRKSNITGIGYEEGRRCSVGCSRKGKIWSLQSGSLADWRNWCDNIGVKLNDANSQPNDFLKYTLIPASINRLPNCEAIMADWPDQLFESSNFRFEVISERRTYGFDDCQIDITTWNAGGDNFEFSLRAGDDLLSILRLRLQNINGDDSYIVEYISGDRPELNSGHDRKHLAEYFTENPPLIRLEDGSQLAGNIVLKPQEELQDTFDRDLIKSLDWAGYDMSKESRWKNGTLHIDSVQQRMINHLMEGPATFIIDDDDTGESADIIAIEEEDQRIIIHLWHCKYSSGDNPGHRVSDLYEVCGQAQKSVKWTWNIRTLIDHLTKRESLLKRGRETRFIRGSLNELATLRKTARRKFIDYKIGIVQPGLSRAGIPVQHLAILGATNSFIQCVTSSPLAVIASV